MIRKDWNFCDQILQALAILDKNLSIFIFFQFSFLFKNIFTSMFHSAVTSYNFYEHQTQ